MADIESVTGDRAHTVLEDLIQLLQDAVESGASVGFLPPLSAEMARAYWLEVIDDIARRKRLLLAARQGAQVVGTVQLVLATMPNALHRAEVQKVMVHTRVRRQGIGQALMAAVDEVARAAGRTLLFLDTRRGDVSEQLYVRQGYIRAGVIPQYARSASSTLDDTVIYYKLL